MVTDWGYKVSSGIGFPYRPARLHRLAGRYDNPMLEPTISPIFRDCTYNTYCHLSMMTAMKVILRRLHGRTLLIIQAAKACNLTTVPARLWQEVTVPMVPVPVTQHCL